MKLERKIAIIVGAGQTPGMTIGNGRATAVLFAREGARVLAIDRNLDSARETVGLNEKEGGEAVAFEADVTSEASLQAAVAACLERWGRIDILHYNVGVSIAGGDAPVTDITTEAFDRIVAYKTTKAAVIALTQQIAIQNAQYGIRANVILPGLMDTAMAVNTRVKVTGKSREEIAAERNARVPLRGKMGTGWDVAYAALFLASDEAGFITGAALPVDGGTSVNLK